MPALELYLSRSLGFALLTLAAITITFTGSIPLTSSYSMTPEQDDPKAPYAVPVIAITSTLHSLVAFYAYTWVVAGGQMTFSLAMCASGGLAAVGLWCLLFVSSGGRINRRTGVDKRMSGFPFGNTEADKKRERKRM